MKDCIRFAVAKLNLSPKKFWKLSWFELSLYIEKFNDRMEGQKAIEEGHWARFRIQWADFHNVNKGKGSASVKPQDLITLSFDSKELREEQKPLTFKEAKALLGSKIRKDG